MNEIRLSAKRRSVMVRNGLLAAVSVLGTSLGIAPLPASAADTNTPGVSDQIKGESNQLKLKGQGPNAQANYLKGQSNQLKLDKAQSNQIKLKTQGKASIGSQSSGAGAGKVELNPQPLPPG